MNLITQQFCSYSIAQKPMSTICVQRWRFKEYDHPPNYRIIIDMFTNANYPTWLCCVTNCKDEFSYHTYISDSVAISKRKFHSHTKKKKKNKKKKKPTQKRYSQIKTDMNRYEHIVILVNDFFISLVTFSERYTLMNVIFAICFWNDWVACWLNNKPNTAWTKIDC